MWRITSLDEDSLLFGSQTQMAKVVAVRKDHATAKGANVVGWQWSCVYDRAALVRGSSDAVICSKGGGDGLEAAREAEVHKACIVRVEVAARRDDWMACMREEGGVSVICATQNAERAHPLVDEGKCMV